MISQREGKSIEVRREAQPERTVPIRAPVDNQPSRPVQASEVTRIETPQNSNRPVSITVQPQTSQPLNLQKTTSITTPIAKIDQRPIASRPVNAEPILSHPPQVVESISLSRPV